jgi:hypothetical protein
VIQVPTETFVSAIMTASVSGAGLVIAFYAFVALMSDRIFERRTEKLQDKHDEIKRIREAPNAFNSENLEQTTAKLKALSDAVNEVKAFPSYLGFLAFADFMLFAFTALLSFSWLSNEPVSRTYTSWLVLAFFFIASIFVFIFVGGTGIAEVYRTIKDRFEKLKKDKEDAQRDAQKPMTVSFGERPS